MTRTRQDDHGLDAFFEAARVHRAEPDAAFHERLTADALASQPKGPRPARPAGAGARRAVSGWRAAFGGWPGLAGLATATVAGVWIGIAQPLVVGDVAFGGVSGGYDFSGILGGSYGLEVSDG